MTVVVDASVVVSALVEGTPTSAWAEAQLSQGQLAAPHLLPYEVVSALRRLVAGKRISQDVAGLARAELAALPVELFPYSAGADRIWELRHSLSTYDASYVALAEALGVSLATVDERLARSSEPRCPVLTP